MSSSSTVDTDDERIDLEAIADAFGALQPVTSTTIKTSADEHPSYVDIVVADGSTRQLTSTRNDLDTALPDGVILEVLGATVVDDGLSVGFAPREVVDT